ncbi:hypothetical protein PC116_g26750 [Phytophthora cactorum]|uniref:Uncharacterized protein n=1 Tax=Phytophthora cactorum TaxID=29920 RepID=A0A8T1JNY5_9STRA|nr:hypothetical protein GQ600_5942 [Phytophthora cactorum]KAG2783119.1 hypothetical protein Pcac1_g7108 [Phytophthora cactorum]KAG2795292.1 hypothetical protein PC111_g22211 [Phytophthora cactorum]KAG2807451.1 hypothetical protein PC112_g17391 [Phytophthora cactorum]KAG2873546.1 hypothetical protein PC114_g25796 [Phytophthora cactorum]
MQSDGKKEQVNRKRQKLNERRNSADSVAAFAEAVSKLVDTEVTSIKGGLIEEKITVACIQREKMERDVLVEKLAAVDGILARRRQALATLYMQIHDGILKGMDVATLKHDREAAAQRVQTAQEKADELQDQIIGC